MPTNTPTVDSKSELRLAREAVDAAQAKLNAVHMGFESMKREREDVLKTLEHELSHCRNGNEREVIHNKMTFTRSETIELIKGWRNDINDCGSELIERNCELRQIIHDLNMKEFDTFKDTVELNALFKAFAFHRETFHSTTWSEFLLLIYRKPTQDELNQYDVLELP